jgi:hypothetical protein
MVRLCDGEIVSVYLRVAQKENLLFPIIFCFVFALSATSVGEKHKHKKRVRNGKEVKVKNRANSPISEADEDSNTSKKTALSLASLCTLKILCFFVYVVTYTHARKTQKFRAI